jgi:DNA modification methylase
VSRRPPAAAWRNRIVAYEPAVDPASLTANPRNWRLHPKGQRDALRGSLNEVGWVDTVLVNATSGRVVDGHARLEEALAAKTTVPVIYAELTDDEEALVLATLDPITAMATPDEEKLSELVASIRVDDDGLRRLLGALAGPEERSAGLTDPDEAPPIRADVAVARGELWALGDHRLLIGDSTSSADVARAVGEGLVDLVWTDPPYGVAYQGGTEERLSIENDALGEDGTRELVRDALRNAPLRPGGSFYVAAPSGPLLLQFMLAVREAGLYHSQTLAWVKDRFVLGRSDFHYRHEAIVTGWSPDDAEPIAGKEHDGMLYGWRKGEPHLFTGGRKLDTVWEVPRPGRSREHPTMKPVELVARALEYSSRPGERVLDLFAGSGTTVIAAEQLDRRAVALELDPRYAQVVIDRWEAFTGRKAERLDG